MLWLNYKTAETAKDQRIKELYAGVTVATDVHRDTFIIRL